MNSGSAPPQIQRERVRIVSARSVSNASSNVGSGGADEEGPFCHGQRFLLIAAPKRASILRAWGKVSSCWKTIR
jgi:hypothetical protein